MKRFQNIFSLSSAGYAAPYGAQYAVKTAIAHPISTSYANTYKVAAAYPAYNAYPAAAYHGAAYHGAAYHAPIAGEL